MPDRVIEWMKQPHENWGTIERIAIREALEKFGLDALCVEVERKLSLAESSAAESALELAREAIKAAAAQTPPTPPMRFRGLHHIPLQAHQTREIWFGRALRGG